MSGKTDMHGFTLVELMITLVLLATLAVIAVPSFTKLIEQNRLQAQADELKAFLLYARSEAVSQNATITVSLDDEDPWTIKRGTQDPIRQLEHDPALAAIRASADEVKFRGNGTATAANFTVCHGTDVENGYFLEIQGSGAVNLFQRGKMDAAGTTDLDNCTL